MKFLRTLSLLLLIAALAPSAHAVVVVYKGSGRFVRGNGQQQKTVATTAFYIVDFNTLEGTFVFAQNTNGAKTVFNDGSRNYGIAEVGLANSNSIRTFFTTISGNYNGARSFTFSSVRLGGPRKNFKIAASAVAGADLPKSITGSYSVTAGTPVAVDGNLSLAFDKNRTYFANGQNLTVTQAANIIIQDYVDNKHYTNVVPVP